MDVLEGGVREVQGTRSTAAQLERDAMRISSSVTPME
jgi:hypothetical protein